MGFFFGVRGLLSVFISNIFRVKVRTSIEIAEKKLPDLINTTINTRYTAASACHSLFKVLPDMLRYAASKKGQKVTCKAKLFSLVANCG